ncbi:MAG TPA: heavy-metal-associated domain-containing protein [Candidatus Bathyarchaeia archaeon]
MEETQSRHLDRLKLRLVEGSCATCVPAIRRQLEKVKGVEWVGANPVLDLIFVDYDPDLIDTDEILQVVKRSGYTAVRASA